MLMNRTTDIRQSFPMVRKKFKRFEKSFSKFQICNLTLKALTSNEGLLVVSRRKYSHF